MIIFFSSYLSASVSTTEVATDGKHSCDGGAEPSDVYSLKTRALH